MFADLDTLYRRGDGIVVGTGFSCFCISLAFGIPGIDVAGATAQPQHDAMVGLSHGEGGSRFRRPGGATAQDHARSAGAHRGKKLPSAEATC